jgi:hypothetical protein
MAEIDESEVLFRQVTEQKKQLKEVLHLLYATINNIDLAKLLERREYNQFKILFDEWISNIYDLFKVTKDSHIILRLDGSLLSLDTSNFIRHIVPHFGDPVIKLFHNYLESTYDSSNLKDKVKNLVEVSCCHYLILDIIQKLTIFFGKSQKT